MFEVLEFCSISISIYVYISPHSNRPSTQRNRIKRNRIQQSVEMAASPSADSCPLQVVFSFDTTGSMSAALKEVRARLTEMLQRLKADIPAVTAAVLAHGDYCDEGSTYITKHIDFTDDWPKLVDFVNNVEPTGGGDEPEAYEVMLRLVRRDLVWGPGSQRVLVVIGDAYPHPPDFPENKEWIDWKEEALMMFYMVRDR